MFTLNTSHAERIIHEENKERNIFTLCCIW